MNEPCRRRAIYAARAAEAQKKADPPEHIFTDPSQINAKVKVSASRKKGTKGKGKL